MLQRLVANWAQSVLLSKQLFSNLQRTTVKFGSSSCITLVALHVTWGRLSAGEANTFSTLSGLSPLGARSSK
jgi:hypothetical protein